MKAIGTCVACVMSLSPAAAETVHVGDPAALTAAANRARPGDVVVLANGTWRDAQLSLVAHGTAAAPITITAETPGKVILSGASNLRIGGEHMVVTGLVFRDGHSPSDAVIALRRDATVASNVRLTGIVIDHFNQPDRRGTDVWLALYGHDNRIDHSWFAGKGNAGATLAIVQAGDSANAGHHRVDHNYFGRRPVLGGSGGETIRIQGPEGSVGDPYAIIEQNMFEDCNGAVALMLIDAGATVIRENLIARSQGSIVLRGGTGGLVERNVIRGDGEPRTGGIYIARSGETVRGNYIERVAGTDATSAIAVANGTSATIEGNSVIDIARITFGVGGGTRAGADRAITPDGRFTNNLIRSTLDPFRFVRPARRVAFAGNRSSFDPPVTVDGGVTRSTKDFAATRSNLLYLPGSEAGAPRDLTPVSRDNVGPAWYSRPVTIATFAGGGQTMVAPGTLADAVRAAKPGDTLRLAPGSYVAAAPIVIARPLTIAGTSGTRIAFTSPTLFQLAEGGSLKLVGVAISGKLAPPSPGNAVVRAAARSTIANYVVMLDDVSITAFSSPDFDVVATSAGTFADRIDIRMSRFAGITGAIVATAAETADGSYPADLIRITKSQVVDVGRVADVELPGAGESGFGPAVEITDNRIVGGASPAIRLRGVRSATVTGNTFAGVGLVDVTPGPGAAITTIRCNTAIDATGSRMTAPDPRRSLGRAIEAGSRPADCTANP